MLKNIPDDIVGRKRHRNEPNTANIFTRRHNVAFHRRLEHRAVAEMESDLRGHFMGVLAIIEAKFEGFDFNLLEMLQLRSQSFHDHIERRRRQHGEASSGVEDGTAAGIDVPNAGRNVEHDAVGGDCDEIDAVEAVVRVADEEFGEGHVARRDDGGGSSGSGGGRGAEDEVAGGGVVAEMVDKAVGEAAAVGVFGGFVGKRVGASA